MTNVFEQITAISTAIIGVSLVVLIIVLIVAAARARQAGKRLEQLVQRTFDDVKPLIQRLQGTFDDLQPVIERGKEISRDLSAVTHSIRGDVEAVSDTVASANDKVRSALEATEERLAEFNALLDVVQNEAEDLFVSTAAAVRGLGRGAASLGRRRGTDLASDDGDGAAPRGAAEEEEGDDDQDDDHESAAESPAPRIRSRARRPRAS